MLASTIAADGDLVPPTYVLGRCADSTLVTPAPAQKRPVLDAAVARQLQQAMILAVQEGRVPALTDFRGGAAAKTGTAERPDGAFDGTLVAYAPADNPRFVVSIRINGAPDADRSGGTDAGPLAKAMLTKALAATLPPPTCR